MYTTKIIELRKRPRKEVKVLEAMLNAKALVQLIQERQFTQCSEEELSDVVREKLGELNERGHLQLVDDDPANIPLDCYMDLAMKPTYALCVLGIYGAVRFGDSFVEAIGSEDFAQLLGNSTWNGMRGHGYEAVTEKLKHLAILWVAPILPFLERYGDLNREFTRFMQREIKEVRRQCMLHEMDGREICVFGFGSKCVTEEFLALRQMLEASQGED